MAKVFHCRDINPKCRGSCLAFRHFRTEMVSAVWQEVVRNSQSSKITVSSSITSKYTWALPEDFQTHVGQFSHSYKSKGLSLLN